MFEFTKKVIIILVIILFASPFMQVQSETRSYDGGGSGLYFNVPIIETGELVPKLVGYSTVVGYTYDNSGATRKINWIEGSAYVAQNGYQSLIASTEIGFISLNSSNFWSPNQVTSSTSSAHYGWAKKDINDTVGRTNIELYAVPIFTTADGCSPLYFMPSSYPGYNEIYIYHWPKSKSSFAINEVNKPFSSFKEIEELFYEAGEKNKQITDGEKVIAYVNGVGINDIIYQKEINIQTAMDGYSCYTIEKMKLMPLIEGSLMNQIVQGYCQVINIPVEERVLKRLIEKEVLIQYLDRNRHSYVDYNSEDIMNTASNELVFVSESNIIQGTEAEKIFNAYAKGQGYSLDEYINSLANNTKESSWDLNLWRSSMLQKINQDELDLFIEKLINETDIVIVS